MNSERGSKTERLATDPIFKQMITTFFQGWEVDIETEVEVARLPRKIDAVVRVPARVLREMHSLTPFWYFLIHNVIEFKGLADALTIHGYQQILSRCYQYLAEHKLRTSELTLTLVSARTPRTVLSDPDIRFKQIAEGYYFYDNGTLEVYLIATNELPIKPENYSLLLFASSKEKNQKIIEEIVKSERGELIQYAFLLHPDITEEVAMANRFRLPRRNMELIAQYLGRDLVTFINPEDRVQDLTPAQRLEGLSDEDRQALLQLWANQEDLTPAQRLQGLSLEDIRDGLSDEERQALRQLLDGQESRT
jgi:hypothetical protein